jgi:MFS family permease
MKAVIVSLAFTLSTTPVLAQSLDHPIADSAAKAAGASAAQDSHGGRSKLFWSGLALGIAGAATGVVATTVARVEDNSTGNAPPTAYQACVAQKRDPVYASNNCDNLKAKNVPMLGAAVALGASGAALMIAGSRVSADISPGVVRFKYRVRF